MKTHNGHKIWISIHLFILIILFLSFAPTSEAADKVPDFTIETSEGENFTLSEQNKPVVIEFMTPLCSDCKKVEDNFKELYPEYENDIIFISIDISESSIEDLKQFKEDREIPWSVGQGSAELFQEYNGVSVPKIVMIDSERFLHYEKTGVVDEEELEREMDEMIGGTSDRIDLQEYGIYTLAVLGGVSSFFSPCSFPLLSSYIAYHIRPNGVEKSEKKSLEGLKMGVKASLGIIIVFGIVGSLLVIGQRWLSDLIPHLQLVVGSLIILLGISILADIDIRSYFFRVKNLFFKKRERSEDSVEKHSSPFYYGLGYGAASAGCTAPVFTAILLASWISGSGFRTLLVLILYLATMAILMIAFSLLTVFFREEVVKNFNRLVGPIKMISGAVLIGAGIYLLYIFFI